MASRCRSFSRPALSLLKSSAKVKKTANISSSTLHSPATFPFPSVPRGALGSLESLLPFHSAVSSARLTSRLGIDSVSRSLSQELGICVPR